MVHLLFATPLGLAASLRPDGFVSGAVSFVRRTLARSVFLGFQIGTQGAKVFVLSGGRLPEALFMVFYWIPKVQKCLNLVDLFKSFQTSTSI